MSGKASKSISELRVCAREECFNEFRPKHVNHRFCSHRCEALDYNLRRRMTRGAKDTIVVTPGVSATDESDHVLISELHKRGYFITKQPQTTGERFEVDLDIFDGDIIRFGVVSDTHLCSRQQQLTHLRTFYRLCAEREIGSVFHAGDLCEGNGKLYRGQIYDLFVHGAKEQIAYMVEHYPKEEGITTYFIAGSHDNSFFKESGFDMGEELAEHRDDMKYLGVHDAYVKVCENVDINLHHPDGGTSYALSYQAQRRVENYTPENKPRLAFFGHYHRSLWMPAYRNVDTFLAMCFQAQTTYLKSKKIFPVIGGWIIELVVNENGLVTVRPECIRFYVPIENDF